MSHCRNVTIIPVYRANLYLDSTEKAPGMFATLVIGLPSRYEGGEVAVKHQGDRMILETSKHGFSYVSWYSDVIHEVLPVRSGYRWVLTYNLCVDPLRQRPTACLQTDEARYLHEVLEDWIAQEDRIGVTPTTGLTTSTLKPTSPSMPLKVGIWPLSIFSRRFQRLSTWRSSWP